MILTRIDEYTRKSLLAKSKKDNPVKFSRRSEIEPSDWSILRIGLLELLASGDLYIYFKVRSYQVGVRILEFKPVLDKYLSGKFKNDVDKAITRALNHSLKYNHIQVSCNCPDFKYRYSYMATAKQYGLDTNETRPASRTNPKNKGGICKHIIKILNAPSAWSKKVTPAIKNYIRYSNSTEESES